MGSPRTDLKRVSTAGLRPGTSVRCFISDSGDTIYPGLAELRSQKRIDSCKPATVASIRSYNDPGCTARGIKYTVYDVAFKQDYATPINGWPSQGMFVLWDD